MIKENSTPDVAEPPVPSSDTSDENKEKKLLKKAIEGEEEKQPVNQVVNINPCSVTAGKVVESMEKQKESLEEKEPTGEKYMLCMDGSQNAVDTLKHLASLMRPTDRCLVINSWWTGDSFPSGSLAKIAEQLGMQDEATKLIEKWEPRPEVEGEMSLDDAMRVRRAESRDLLDIVKCYFQRHGVEHVNCTSIEAADCRELLISMAKRHQIDTIVVGTRGLGIIKSLLLGSVSSYVLSHAPCSVLVHKATTSKRLPVPSTT